MIENDQWADWLLHGRNGGNAELENIICTRTNFFADKILDSIDISENMVLADIGAGDGLVAFKAIKRIGPSLRVILSDISRSLIDRAKNEALLQGVYNQCTFLTNRAESLDGIESGSVDVVTTRSVLAYIHDKAEAFREFWRILKPGGKFSIAEPVMQDEARWVAALGLTLKTQNSDSNLRFLELLYRWKSHQFPPTVEKMENNPLFNYSERDLAALAVSCGFTNIHLEFHIDIYQEPSRSLDLTLDVLPFPAAKSLRQIMEAHFSHEEATYFTSVLRPKLESETNTMTEKMVYISGQKPLE